MKRITCIFMVVCLCLNLTGCRDGGGQGDGQDAATDSGANVMSQSEAFREAERILKKMSLDEKIGQMFVVSIDKLTEGEEPVTGITDELRSAVETYRFGGIIIGNRNITGVQQLKEMTGTLSGYLDIPMYIGTQEEGGGENSIAAHNDEITATGYTSPAEMGKNMSEGQLEDTGEVIAKELSELGFNLNLAPVADVAENAKAVDADAVSGSAVSVVGEPPRYEKPAKKLSKKKKKKHADAYQKKLQEYNKALSDFLAAYQETVYAESCFSSEEDKVSEAVGAMVKGMHVGRIATVLKTFPGIASVAEYHKLVETHIDTGLSRLRRVNFEPFAAGIDEGTDFIMVGHVCLSKIDKETPASLSRTILSDLLRKEMGFEGMIMTEPLDVPVITSQYTVRQAVIKAVMSGADVIYDPADIDEAFFALRQAVMFNEIDEKRINQAVLRILQSKLQRGIYVVDNKKK
ncbi:MAG: hypothetical protein NC293_01830 [Roseburia sp.]|nr:hypothetical protein [Roseburia sp.]